MKDKQVLPLKEYKDLEDFVCELDGERHGFFKHKTTEGIYIVDLRPYREKKRKNDTNIRGDSDVDVVVQLNRTFQPDLILLSQEQKDAFNKAYEDATYPWKEFRKDALQALQNHFGKSAITEGNRSLKLTAGSGRLPADIIPCLQYRRYLTFPGYEAGNYVPGIVFYTHKENPERKIVNFPIPHYKNGIAKNSEKQTNGWYKPTVRVFKNCRTYMEDHGTLQDGIAPSYFVECLMYNVPNSNYGTSYQTTFYNILKFLSEADLTNFNCQNGQTSLFGSTPEQWTTQNGKTFITGLITLWNGWK